MALKRLVRRARQLQEYTLDLMLVGVRRQSSKLWSSYDICAGADKKALFQSQLHAMRHCHLYLYRRLSGAARPIFHAQQLFR